MTVSTADYGAQGPRNTSTVTIGLLFDICTRRGATPGRGTRRRLDEPPNREKGLDPGMSCQVSTGPFTLVNFLVRKYFGFITFECYFWVKRRKL